MFPAYNKSNANDSNKISESNPNIHLQTRSQIQAVAKHQYITEQRLTDQKNEDSVFLQSGFGESSSDDDCGGVRVPLAASERRDADEIFKLPEQRKLDLEKRKRIEAQQASQSAFSTFPCNLSDQASRNLYKRSEPKNRHRSRSRKRSKNRKRSREYRNNHRSNSRGRKKKRKRNVRRSSSSSSDSSCSTIRSSRTRSPSIRKISDYKPAKYEFLTNDEFIARDSLATRIMDRYTRFDHENFSLGISKKEVAKCRLGVNYIVGLESYPTIFHEVYGKECAMMAREKENRPFLDQLIFLAQHVPQETFFRTRSPNGGFWKLVQHRDILNENQEFAGADSSSQADAFLLEIERTRRKVNSDAKDIGALIRLIQMEEEQACMNAGSFARSDPRALAERHLEMVEQAMKANYTNPTLDLMKIDMLIKMEKDVDYVIHRYKSACSKYPYDPMLWMKYLDYVQYNSSVYTFERMSSAFKKCLHDVSGLANQTMVSHLSFITDVPMFRTFHLSVYIRYLKWQISCGQVPLVLANIQATFEWNFGLSKYDKRFKDGKNPRYEALHLYWKSCLPRIGDDNGLGAETLYKQVTEPPVVIQEMEKRDFDELIACCIDAIDSCLRIDRDHGTSFVEFERVMQEYDARPKRTQLRDCVLYEEHAEELEMFTMCDSVEIDFVTYYDAPSDYESFDYVQPLLELLGVKFLHSTNCFTTSEQVISEWIPNDVFRDSAGNFSRIPTYSEKTCLKFGNNFLRYLITQRHLLCKSQPEVLDELLVKFITASFNTKASEMEKTLIFHQLKPKVVDTLLRGFIKEYQDIMKHYSSLRHVISLIAADRLIIWWEQALEEQNSIMKLDKMKESLYFEDSKVDLKFNYIVTDGNKDNVRKVRDKIWSLLDTGFPRYAPGQPTFLRNRECPLPTLQLHLYANILRARMSIHNQDTLKEVRQALLMEILQMDEEYVKTLDNEKIMDELKRGMIEMREIVYQKEDNESFRCIPELPRAQVLCDALQIAINFVFLDKTNFSRKTVIGMVDDVIAKFKKYEENKVDWKRGATEKYRDRMDIQFLLDTLVSFFSHNNYTVTYAEDYQKLIIQASETFTCESKYMKKLSELFSRGRLHAMKLRGIIDKRNKILLEKQVQHFDVEIERRLLMNTLTNIYAWMKVSQGIGDTSNKMMYDIYKKEAMAVHDPVIWRLALRAANNVSWQTLHNDAFVRAMGQCPWALNLHLDYVEGMGTHRTEEKSPAQRMIYRFLKDAGDQLHALFIDDDDILMTQVELGKLKSI